MAASRRDLVAKVHVARKQMALRDADYRAIAARVTGHDSARDCTDAQLIALLTEFRRLGWQQKTRQVSGKPHVRKVWAIWGDLRPLLDDAGHDTLRAFVRRQTRSVKNPDGVSDPEWLSPEDATKVIRGLEGWLARVRAKGETADA